jgi:TRAP-type C4-dicarboxylate transport system substrate-binding protein
VFQAAFLTPAGLASLDESFNVFSMPFFLESTEEEAAVVEKVTPIIERRLQPKGFHLLCWGTGGWVEEFSKKPLKTLADVKTAKLFTSKGSDKWVQWYVANGFHPVALTPADIPAQLKKPLGLIDAAPSPPRRAGAPDFPRRQVCWISACAVHQRARDHDHRGNRLSEEDRVKLTAAAQAFEKRVRVEVPTQDAASIKAMQARGLEIIPLDAKAVAEFRAAGSELVKTMRGGMVPADAYDAAIQARDAFRQSKGK